jgi:hypothetical protein
LGNANRIGIRIVALETDTPLRVIGRILKNRALLRAAAANSRE